MKGWYRVHYTDNGGKRRRAIMRFESESKHFITFRDIRKENRMNSEGKMLHMIHREAISKLIPLKQNVIGQFIKRELPMDTILD